MKSKFDIKVLFVCSKNKWRSPTGEAIFRRRDGVSVRSAGTSRSAKKRLNLNDIRWSDIILVMEDKHATRIRADFRDETKHKKLHILDISDDYQFMNPELVEILRAKCEPLIWPNF